MATGTTSTSALQEIARDHLKCGICYDRYKQPKLLDCVHSFCKHCLEKYMFHKNQFRGAAQILCPVCKQKTVVPKTGIPGLKTNFHLIGIVEDFALQEKVLVEAGLSKTELMCEICNSNRATNRCLDCRQNICSDCRTSHLRFSTSSNHTVAALEDICEGNVTAKKAPEQDASKCQKHKGEVNHLYCETCQELICSVCTVIDHKSHQYIDQTDASTKYKRSLNNKIETLNSSIEGLITSLVIAAQAREMLNNNESEISKVVRQKAAKMIAEVKAKEKQLLDELKVNKQDFNNKLHEYEETVNKMLQRKQHSREKATDVTTTASDSDFLSVYPVINKDLETLSSQQPPKVSGMCQCQKVIQQTVCDINLGKLVVENMWELCCEFGKWGRGAGEFEGARGIAASQRDEIAVADWKNERIVICNNRGECKSSIPTIANDIAATPNQWVAVSPRHAIVYNNCKDHTLAHWFQTVPQSEVGKTDVWLMSVAVKENGNIIVGDKMRNMLTEHNPTDGSLIRTMPVEIEPDFMAVMDNGRIAVSSRDMGRLDVVDDNAATICTIRPTITGQTVNYCRGVCYNSSGIYIAVKSTEYGSGHIHHYDDGGHFISCIIQGLYWPHGITFTADGQQLAVADWHSVKIYHKV